ncbi:putative alpha-1,2-mannosidase [Chitinophaga terrae (ex Kim and Jung 2007)]|uniref:GH92 family glycosyl hydrolase n=1 Tax=Chitinophaga terrae (ex Kim and Jung 2007) TaxID=408074 RepID=UPI0027856B36|nr:GH92 family glycosyl hydrolase [Chitinophaga terrae (ex Kim and Jung 2007)]MDQ0108897.1 putative alpha-1,2-mannosidase [Chitinophaga terrae (ex Kim and Jung 2007)]
MQLPFKFILATGLLFLCACGELKKQGAEEYIDPTIGNMAVLLQPTRPVMQLPNEMIRMYPIRRDHSDDQISGFPLQVVGHNQGTVFVMKPAIGVLQPDTWKKKLTYDRDLEIIHPWYYKTTLLDDSITVEFTPGRKTGMYRFSFPKQSTHYLICASNGYQVNGKQITGYTLFHDDVPVYLYGQFSTAAVTGLIADTLQYIRFDGAASDVTFKYAVSYVSLANARHLFDEEINDKGFDSFSEHGRECWRKVTDQIRVEGGTLAQRRSFYTALYRCHSRMVNIAEDSLYYSGYNKKVNVTHEPFYVDDACWDTYQALHPLRMILNPAQEEAMLASYVRMYEQSGWMPTFPRIYGDHPCMNGFHSTIIFLDAYRKGLKIRSLDRAYEGMKKNALQATMLPWKNGPAGALDSFYYAHGYFPALAPGEAETHAEVHDFEKRQAVAVTLGHSYDDWALAQLAAALKKPGDAALFSQRARNYQHLWNSEKKFFMPKDEKGAWIEIDPALDGGPGGREYYDENNGWTYLWQVQHDIPGLIKLMNGEKAVERRLDELFRTELGMPKYEFWHRFPDATGLVGQFSMGNEPGFHIPYLYNYVGAAWKTQKRVRELLDLWFKDNVFGIPGDEDGGGMSAFVVFSSMGFYPVTPGIPIYTIGSPVFSKVSIALPSGKEFTIIAKNCSVVNKYIRKATLNGEVLNAPFFTHQQLMQGGVLELEMTEYPDKRWWASVHAPE